MEIESMPSFIFQCMANIKEEVLSSIMKQVLGRDPTYLDAPDFEIISHENYPGREYIGFKGNLLGEIVMTQKEENNQWRMGFEFTPKNTFE